MLSNEAETSQIRGVCVLLRSPSWLRVRGAMNKQFLTGPICTSPHGLTTTAELRAGGLSLSAISKRVARGALHRRYPGVYSYGPGELSSEAQAMASVLAAGPGAVLAHL